MIKKPFPALNVRSQKQRYLWMTSTETLIHITHKGGHSPGPSEYNYTPQFGNNAPKFTLGKPKEENRSRKKKEEDKGIGYQCIQSTVGQGPKIAFHSRPKDTNLTPSPGPNYVPPPFGKESMASSFHSRRGQKTSNLEGPGPGEYSVPTVFGNGKKFSMRSRTSMQEGLNKVSPGPSEYVPNYDFVRPNTKHSSIHPRIEIKDSRDAVPGPGEYVIPSSLKKEAPTFHVRTKERNIQTSPGPAAYNTNRQLGKDSKMFSMRFRIETRGNVIPVPYYEAKSTIGDGRKSSMHERTPLHKPEATPGPNYMPPQFGNDSYKTSLYSRRDPQEKTKAKATPGPGEYAIQSTFGKGPKFSLRGRVKMPEERSDTPGPGEYKPDFGKMDNTRKSAIGARIPEKVKVMSGGYVKLPDQNTGPKFTIGTRDPLPIEPGTR